MHQKNYLTLTNQSGTMREKGQQMNDDDWHEEKKVICTSSLSTCFIAAE